MLGNTRPKHAQTEKRKTCLADFVAEMQREEAEEAARIQEEEEQARRMTRQQRVEAEKKRLESQSRFERSLRKDQIQPLVDLAYSESMLVQRSAVGLLATLSINADNKDILISAGSLKPLLANCSPEVDFVVRRQALQGLANMTSREDIRARMCSIPGGLKVIIDGVKAADMQSRLAAAEACANIASSMKLRGRLVQEGVLPAVASMLYARAPELKRWGMVALQRLSMSASAQGNVVQTKEDPEGDGYASEIVNEGVLPPLLQLLRGGPQIEEDLRTIAMQSIYEICNASDEVRVRLCREHAELLKVVVGLMLLDEFPGGATQREACRVVQLLCLDPHNLAPLLAAGVLAALSVLSRAESQAKKQVAAMVLYRIALDAECRVELLNAGGARTLCHLARATLPRKVARPAVSALTGMSSLATCVLPLLESGCGSCLAALATSSDPELRTDGAKALADMASCQGLEEPLKVTDMLLAQGALGVFLGAAYSRDRATQLAASRGLLAFARRSPTHCRIIARKGAARSLCALVLGRDAVLINAVKALHAITVVLTKGEKEPGLMGGTMSKLSRRRMGMVKGVLEVGVVGTSKELWARLNDDGGMPAAQLMRVARLNDGDGVGDMAQSILRDLKPEVLHGVYQDMPERSGYAPEAVAERAARSKCVAKIQQRFRALLEQRNDDAGGGAGGGATAKKPAVFRGASLFGAPAPSGSGWDGRLGLAFSDAVRGAIREAGKSPRERASKAADLKELRAAAADGIGAPPSTWAAGSAANAANAANAGGGAARAMPLAAGGEDEDRENSSPPGGRFQTPEPARRAAGSIRPKVSLEGYAGVKPLYNVPPGSIAAAMSLPGSARDLVKAMTSTPSKAAAKRANQKAEEANAVDGAPAAALTPQPPAGGNRRRPMSASPRGRH